MRVYLARHQYSHIRQIDNHWYGIIRTMAGVCVCLKLNARGMAGKFVFQTWEAARVFLKNWNGITLPTVGTDGCIDIK